MKNKIIILFLLALIIFISGCGIQESKEIMTEKGELIQTGTRLNDLAPDLRFESLNGQEIKFSDFRGNVLIVNSWAVWCPFCINEMPDLQKASDELDNVEVLFIHRTATESFDKAESYLNDFGVKGAPITDNVVKDETDNFYKTFFGFGMPVSLFIDKEGYIRDKKIGSMQLKEIKERVQKII